MGGRGCRLPGAWGSGRGADAGGPLGTSRARRRLHESAASKSARDKTPSHAFLRSVGEAASQRARQAGCLFYFTCFTASAEAAPRRPATHNLASEFALTHSLAHSVETLLVPAACRGTLSQAAGTQELPSSGGWKFLGFKFQFHAFFLKHWHLRRGAVGGSLQDRVWLGPKRGH